MADERQEKSVHAQPERPEMPPIEFFVEMFSKSITGSEKGVSKSASDSNRITREYLDSLMIAYKYLQTKTASTRFHFLGEDFETPVMCGGMAALVQKMHEGGMVTLAEGVKRAGAVMWTGYVSDAEFEAISQVGAKTIRIVKPLQDEERIYRDLQNAEACGALAVAMDVDHGIGPDGEPAKGSEGAYGDLCAKSLEDLRAYIGATKLPFIVKGILHPDEAVACKEAGAAAILASHHKGEVSFAVPPVMMLPEIRKAVGNDFPIIADCGIVSGMDAFKALAQGANGVCTARSLMKPFAKEGAVGVEMYLRQMTAELKAVMARTGARDLASIDPSVIRQRNF